MRTLIAAPWVACIGAIVVFCSLHGSARADYCDDTFKQYNVVHINGILKTLKESHNDLRALKQALGTSYKDKRIEYTLAFNKSSRKNGTKFNDGFTGLFEYWGDRNDLYEQFYSQNVVKKREDLARYLLSNTNDDGAPQAILDAKKEAEAEAALVTADSEIYGLYNAQAGDFSYIYPLVRRSYSENQNLIIVPHSQGALYANAVYSFLLSDPYLGPKLNSSLAITAIAPAASRIAGEKKAYYTSYEDNAITLLGVKAATYFPGAPMPLAPNIHVSTKGYDWTHHDMGTVYLYKYSEAHDPIVQAIHDQMDALKNPDTSTRQGAITFSLSWSSNADVDLHVYEPDGTHVFYESVSGNFGELDYDIMSGTGPEHYFVPCNKLSVGTYKIAADYVEGSASQSLTLTVKTPGKIADFQATIASANTGTLKNMAELVVEQDAKGKYTYKISAL